MARIRSIKPEFFKHLELNELENSNPELRIMLVYAGLWTQCDKNGVFFYNAKVLKNEILPYVDFDMQKTLNILEKEGYFFKYKVNNRDYGFVSNFYKYQFPTKQEKDSPAKYPKPPENILDRNKEQEATSQNASLDVPDNDTDNVIDNVTNNHTTPEGRRKKDNRIKEKGIHGDSNEPPFSDEVIELSNLLLITHRKTHPDYLSGKDDQKIILNWAKDIDLLIRIDKKAPENIRQVILWVKTKGNFWFANICSGKKLREKYETLWAQMQAKSGTSPPIQKIALDNIPDNEVMQYFKGAV